MAGRPMTHSLAFVNFLPHNPELGDDGDAQLSKLAQQECDLLESVEKLQESIRVVRETAKDMLLDFTPRAIAKAKAEAKADADEKAQELLKATIAR